MLVIKPDTPAHREEIGMRIARAIAPESWKEFDTGNGVCSNQAGHECMESIAAAKRVMDELRNI